MTRDHAVAEDIALIVSGLRRREEGGLSHEPMPFWYRLAAAVLHPLMTVLTRRIWRGAEHLPREGGVVVCSNHISFADPLVLAHFVHDHGRTIRLLAKASLFRLPVIGALIRGAGQIPVERSGPRASGALQRAVQAVRRGECIAIYPEGTLGNDPGGWPMGGKTGAARIALTTGAPVIPVAQWGAQELLPAYSARLSVWPRKTVHVVAGPAVDLAEYENRELTPELLRAATERITRAITDQLAEIRGESPPDIRFDIRLERPSRRARNEGEGERDQCREPEVVTPEI